MPTTEGRIDRLESVFVSFMERTEDALADIRASTAEIRASTAEIRASNLRTDALLLEMQRQAERVAEVEVSAVEVVARRERGRVEQVEVQEEVVVAEARRVGAVGREVEVRVDLRRRDLWGRGFLQRWMRIKMEH